MTKKRSWNGYMIVSNRKSPVGVSLIDGTRIGFIEIFITREVAMYYIREKEIIKKVRVTEL